MGTFLQYDFLGYVNEFSRQEHFVWVWIDWLFKWHKYYEEHDWFVKQTHTTLIYVRQTSSDKLRPSCMHWMCSLYQCILLKCKFSNYRWPLNFKFILCHKGQHQIIKFLVKSSFFRFAGTFLLSCQQQSQWIHPVNTIFIAFNIALSPLVITDTSIWFPIVDKQVCSNLFVSKAKSKTIVLWWWLVQISIMRSF